jgi:signal transduction histidine kinase
MKVQEPKIANPQILEGYAATNLEPAFANEFEMIVDLINRICKSPYILISLIDVSDVSFIAQKGIAAHEMPTVLAFSNYCLQQPSGFFEIKDTTIDERFTAFPLILNHVRMQYFASVALHATELNKLVTINILDDKPNQLEENQTFALTTIAFIIAKIAEAKLNKTQADLYKQYQYGQLTLEKNILNIVQNHVLKPIENLKSTIDLCGYELNNTDEKNSAKDIISNQINNTINTLDTVLEWGDVHILNKYQKQATQVNIYNIVQEIIQQFLIEATLKNNRILNLTDNHLYLTTDFGILKFILKNLIANANAVTENGTITIYAEEELNHIMMSVSDSGRGMTPHQVQTLFSKEKNKENDAVDSNIELSFLLVKDFIQQLNGSIQINSEPREGTAIYLYFLK